MKNLPQNIDEEFESLWEKDFGGHFDVIGKTDLKEIVQHFYELGCAQTKKEISEYCYSQLDVLNVCGNPIKLGKRDFLASIMDFCENGDNYPVTEDEPSWKPSEEQMNGLAHAINLDVYDAKRYGLDSLYSDLKKLM